MGTRGISYYLHRLITESFLEKTEGKDIVDHFDQEISNNQVTNLRWITKRENSGNQDKVRNVRVRRFLYDEKVEWQIFSGCT